MGLEIERKFLVDAEKWRALKKPKGVNYRQGYLVDNKDLTLRVRIAGNQGYITIKGATTGITRKEFEQKIPAAQAVEMLNSFAASSVEKIRHKIKVGGKVWEVDDFKGDNEGLLMAEIELKSENEHFEKPDWVTIEVSDDNRYYNSSLSKNPFKNWGK